MVILLYFLASVFIVIGFMMLFAYRRTRRKELLILSFVYAGSGLSAGYSLQWWPLISGFIVAWLLKFAGYDPDKPPKRASLAGTPPKNSGSGKE